jgi:signal transduction histidine kinase/CheY-like chemotaxis protein
MSTRTRRFFNVGYALVLAVLAINGVGTFLNIRTIVVSDRWIDHTREVVIEIERSLSTLKDAETGQRGYLLTGEEGYLEPFRLAEEKLGGILDHLATLTSDNPSQQARIAEFRRLKDAEMGELRQTAALRRGKGMDAALAVVRKGRERRMMERARRVAVEMATEEDRLLGLRRRWSSVATRRSVAPFSVSTGTAILLLGLVFHLKRREDAEQERDLEELRESQREVQRLLGAEHSARTEAEQANRAKDQFLAVLSHELRTPLNPVLLAVTAILGRPTLPGPDEVRPTLEMIRRNVTLQARLIDDLLDVMRIVRGKLPLQFQEVDLHALIRQAVETCRNDGMVEKGLRVVEDLSAGRHLVHGDPARLGQVIWNVVKNAAKFTTGGGMITIRTRNEGDGDALGDRLIVEVEDTGIGIEPGMLGPIFDPFQQGESSSIRSFGGLGLGVAIGGGIAEAHGGALTAESTGNGRGATFRLVLRALPGPQAGEDCRPGEDEAGRSGTPPLKILLVEDEPTTLGLLERLLRGLGHEVTAANTLASATEAARSGAHDLIVSDIGLPDGSGLDLMRRIAAEKGSIPAIALTGFGTEEDIRRSLEAGFSAHMTKPIDFAELEASIRQVVDRGRPRVL